MCQFKGEPAEKGRRVDATVENLIQRDDAARGDESIELPQGCRSERAVVHTYRRARSRRPRNLLDQGLGEVTVHADINTCRRQLDTQNASWSGVYELDRMKDRPDTSPWPESREIQSPNKRS